MAMQTVPATLTMLVSCVFGESSNATSVNGDVVEGSVLKGRKS